MNISIRTATHNDKDFLIRSIIESEKSGSDVISYCAIFSIDENTFIKVLNNILDENIEGQELCISNFLVAEVDGEKASALSTWIEKESGNASNVIKTNLLMYFLERNILLDAAPSLKLMNEVNIPREEGALQVECVYTVEKYRGMGLAGKLINEHIIRKKNTGAQFDKVQVILLKNNLSAIKSYERAGFSIMTERRSAGKNILKLIPCDTKILMERNLSA